MARPILPQFEVDYVKRLRKLEADSDYLLFAG
jgi:hypothetical protein